MRISDWSSDVCSSDLLPESFLDHPLAPRLVRNGDLVPLGQILDRQGRTELIVVLADKAENLIAHLRFECTLSRAAALPVSSRPGTGRTHPVQQLVNLPPTDAESPPRTFTPQLP